MFILIFSILLGFDCICCILALIFKVPVGRIIIAFCSMVFTTAILAVICTLILGSNLEIPVPLPTPTISEEP